MSLRTWNDGAKGFEVKEIVDNNFKILGKHLSDNVLALTTKEIKGLSDDYLHNGLLVYDTDRENWYQYKNGMWNLYPIKFSSYSISFSADTWSDNTINIPYSTHSVPNPIVELYILVGELYQPVLGGVNIDNEYNITLSTDMAFDGKVVIK